MAETINLSRGDRHRVDADSDNRVTVTVDGSTVYYGGPAVSSTSNDGNVTDGNSVTLSTSKWFQAGASGSAQLVIEEAPPAEDQEIVGDVGVTGEVGATVEAYADDGSKQAVWGDLDLAAGAGTSDQGDTSFLGGVMGNIIGSALTKTHNFIGGLIGAYSVDTSNATDVQAGGVLGVIMDGGVDADGCVVAIIDGGDPSTTTRANAAFAARINNNSGDSGVDYGLDLFDAGRDETLYTGGGDALEIANADLRLHSEICFFSSATEPVDGTTGDGFAARGSICVAEDTGVPYRNSGTKADPVWVALADVA